MRTHKQVEPQYNIVKPTLNFPVNDHESVPPLVPLSLCCNQSNYRSSGDSKNAYQLISDKAKYRAVILRTKLESTEKVRYLDKSRKVSGCFHKSFVLPGRIILALQASIHFRCEIILHRSQRFVHLCYHSLCLNQPRGSGDMVDNSDVGRPHACVFWDS